MIFSIITQISRNEEKRLRDWVKYHSDLGINEFLIYLDNCNDSTEKLVVELSKKYNIIIGHAKRMGEYVNTDNPNIYGVSGASLLRILDSYKRGLEYVRQKYKNEGHWSIFIDVDEYLVPQKDLNLSDIVKLAPRHLHRIYIASYDFKCPFDLDLPVFTQTYYRWSEKTRKNGIVNGVAGWFKYRGKSYRICVGTLYSL
jgi:hypothetical protein